MGERVAVLGRVLASRGLRRAALAFAAFTMAEYGVWVAMLVYAFARGGSTTAAIVAVVQLVPAALVAAPAATLADSRGGAFALRLGYVMQATAMGVTAILLLAAGPALLAYALAAVAASAVTLTRPAQASFVAAVATHPDELTAATALSSWIEGASVLLGPALAGLLIALDGPGLVFAVFAGLVATGAGLVSGIRPGRPRAAPHRDDEREASGALGGLAALRAQTGTRSLLLVLASQFVVIGALDVLTVFLAVAVLNLGSPGAGYLTAAFGAGGILGGMAALGLVGARSLARPLIAAALAWAALFVVLITWTTAASAFVLLGAAGTARGILDVAGRTLLTRVTSSHVLARVFGVLEGLTMASLAIGSLLVAPLVGAGAALGGVAGVLAVATILAVPRLLVLDRHAVARAQLTLLRGYELFAALPVPVLEGLANQLSPLEVGTGRTVIREGDVGEDFYLVARGHLLVLKGGSVVARLGPGTGFGEIALLQDVPRTASVIADSSCLLYSLRREPFLEALAPAARG
jgi:hypothetical protein